MTTFLAHIARAFTAHLLAEATAHGLAQALPAMPHTTCQLAAIVIAVILVEALCHAIAKTFANRP